MSDIILPTTQACKAFGICRVNEDIEARSRPNTYGFIEGPQARALFSSDNFDFATKFYDTYNYKPKFTNTNDPVHANLEKNVIDEVILEFLENRPTRMTHREDDGRVVHTEYKDQVKEDKVIQTIRIAPNTTDWLKFSHDQEWGEHGGLVQSVIKAIGGIAQSVESFMAAWHNILSDDTRERRIVKTEFTHEWQGTKHITFDIPFVLFTAGGSIEAFRRDIFSPIMELNKLIYPRRYTSKEMQEMDDNIRMRQYYANVQNAQERDREADQQRFDGEVIPSAYHFEDDYYEEGGDPDRSAGDSISGAIDRVMSATPGSRMAFLKPPSHIRITHSSGLFRFARCAITSFTYNYKGPWIKFGEDEEWFNKMQSDYSAIFGLPNFLSRGFPCIAECNLSVTCLDPLYADDWSEIYNNSDIVNISKGNAGVATGEDIEVIDPNDSPSSSNEIEDRIAEQDQAAFDEIYRQREARGETFAQRYDMTAGAP